MLTKMALRKGEQLMAHESVRLKILRIILATSQKSQCSPFQMPQLQVVNRIESPSSDREVDICRREHTAQFSRYFGWLLEGQSVQTSNLHTTLSCWNQISQRLYAISKSALCCAAATLLFVDTDLRRQHPRVGTVHVLHSFLLTKLLTIFSWLVWMTNFYKS